MPQSKAPRIALPCSMQQHGRRPSTYQINAAYVESVLAAGGIPVLLPTALPIDALPEMIDTFDGFLLSGGGDIDPDRYGGSWQANMHGADPERDAFELALVPLVLQQDKPLLAICRGIQVLNVALGGDLIGDIATQVPNAQKHDWYPEYDRDRLSHAVSVVQGSRLAEILQSTTVQTNSLHHQALNQIGTGLAVSAHAPDVIIEAVEMPDRRFVIGVQWHPECLPQDPKMRSLFRAFVDASR